MIVKFYALAIGLIVAIAMIDPNRPLSPLLLLAALLTLPTSLFAVPPFYVGASIVWNLSNADNGGQSWPVLVFYTWAAVVVAFVNGWCIQAVRRRQR